MSVLVLSEILNPEGLELVAVDIDDVLNNFKKDFIAFYNNTHGIENGVFHTEQTVAGYVDLDITDNLTKEEFVRRVRSVHESGASLNFNPREDALEVLPRLARVESKLGLVAITARQPDFADITKKYLDKNFPGIFMGLAHTDLHPVDGSKVTHKYEICNMLGIKTLIDDSPVNCQLAAANGLLAICFGDHDWNLSVTTQPNLITLPDWYAAERFLTPRESYDLVA